MTLHFTEIYHRDAGKRSFDVLLEGKRFLKNYEPRFATAESKSGPVTVRDGFLEIRLLPRIENPKISAIEIVAFKDSQK